ncbi:beta-lactamase family protein [Kitasatospora sp. RB6PN24]|uniref:serine hydrolase domain-containing protein n=1 Tax=Kitasatospora humi TaxID=2893891 RepID=UPI001E4372E5|nr:serine hydrolase domain-containing protein [Kitasatospora humi]MCC9310291.1 beta-lactamase family protein [Kitasatospora humi]
MKSPATRTRWTTAAAAAALTAALAVGTITPAIAATTAGAPAAAGAVAAGSSTTVPPLDPAAIRQALADRPAADVSGGFVQVTGSAGKFTGTSGQGINPDGRFRIGSISKVFTATVVLQLAAEGRVDLNGTVQQYLPGVLPAGFPPIEVGQLLNHTSGLPGGSVGWGNGGTDWFADHRFDSWTPQQIVAGMAGEQMSFQPGTAQQYNGMNTFVAGMVIEKVTGHSYAQEVRRRIIQPLGLRDTSVPKADDPRLPDAAAHPYLTVQDPNGGSHQVDVTEQSPWPWAEGGLISSAPDLSHFFDALFRGRLLPPAQQQLLFTVPDVPDHQSSHCNTGPTAGRACMSMGLERAELNGLVVWGKTGSRPGWTSGVFATRDLSRTVVYSVNPTGLDGAETPYWYGIATAAFGIGQQKP